MNSENLKKLDVQEMSLSETNKVNGGFIWEAIAIASMIIYIYDHRECIKAGIKYEFQK